MRSRVPSFVLVAAVGIGSLAGCAKNAATQTGSSPAASASAASFPVTLNPTNEPVTIPARPVRIVSLSPTLTEDLYAIGAGSQVVAVDKDSNYPPTATVTSLDGFTPNVEAIAGYKPDLVVLSYDTKGLVASLTGLHIPTLNEPAAVTLDDAYHEITELGTATGHPSESATLVSGIKAKIQSLVASVPTRATPYTYYYELDPMFDTATSSTFVGSLFKQLGMKNIADAADSAANHYPTLSAESVVAANPDFIFLADTKCCSQNAAAVGARPGFATLSAVKSGHVVSLDDDVASRWGPRITDLLAAIATAVKGTPASLTP